MQEETIKQLYVKLDPEKDDDIIQFLLNKPRTYIVKEALRQYIKGQEEPQAAATPEPPKVSRPVQDDSPFSSMNMAPKR